MKKIPTVGQPRQPDKPKEHDKIYATKRWKAFRKQMIAGKPVCERCQIMPSQCCHHRTDLADDLSLAYVSTNIECLCLSCHNRETRLRQLGNEK